MTNEAEDDDRRLGFTELREYLAHEHPMVFLDRVEDYEPGERFEAILAVSGNMDVIAGHFPDRAIFPGTHLIQAFSQCGIIFYQLSTSPLEEDEMTVVGGIKSRFFHPAVPGDIVRFEVKADRLIGDTFQFSGRAMVDGERVGAFEANLVRRDIDELEEVMW